MTDIAETEPLQAASSAYAAGHFEAAFEILEGAHAAAALVGDRPKAAATATRIALHLLCDTGLLAPVRGWLRRAERFLEEGPDTEAVHAWLAFVHAYERFLSGDYAEALRWSETAIATGERHGEPGAAAMGMVCRARCHIIAGDLDLGLQLLEEAAVSATSGPADLLTKGYIYCEIVCAWQGLGMYELAEEWTDAMERFSSDAAIGSVHGRCRIHRAEMLRLRGRYRDAEREALMACDELRPFMRREFGWPLTELGSIRLRLGDLEGAEQAFLAALEKGWEPQPGLALLRLAQGNVDAAVSLIADALDRPMDIPSKELPPRSDLRRAPLLAAQVEIALAAGEIKIAQRAEAELRRIANAYASLAINAAACVAHGRVLVYEGDSRAAIDTLRESVRIWSELDAPYETAEARMQLAKAYEAQGASEPARLELEAARSALARVDRTVESSPSRTQVNELFHEGDFWTLAFDGKTTLLRDMRGLTYIERLLARPGREIHVVDLSQTGRAHTSEHLTARDDGLSYSTGGDAGPMLDERAKNVYRRRLEDIDDDIQEASTFGDTGRIARAEAERDFLMRELARAVGMDGRDRRAGATSERARAAVTRAIRGAMKKIATEHPGLGEHLERTIQTGTYCSYQPDPLSGVVWRSRS